MHQKSSDFFQSYRIFMSLHPLSIDCYYVLDNFDKYQRTLDLLSQAVLDDTRISHALAGRVCQTALKAIPLNLNYQAAPESGTSI